MSFARCRQSLLGPLMGLCLLVTSPAVPGLAANDSQDFSELEPPDLLDQVVVPAFGHEQWIGNAPGLVVFDSSRQRHSWRGSTRLALAAANLLDDRSRYNPLAILQERRFAPSARKGF